MTVLLIVLACTFGAAILLTLAMINLSCFFCMKELVKALKVPDVVYSDDGEPGVYDPDKGRKLSGEELKNQMSDFQLDTEDVIAGFGK